MTTNPPKRVFSKSVSEPQLWRTQNDTDEDLTARLRGLGSRVRKSVMEGYHTGTSGSTAPGSPTAHTQPSIGTHIFQSAKDTLREIYPVNASTSVSHTSHNKRGRATSEELETASSDIHTEHPDEDMPYSGPSFSGPELRPIKPLKRSGRQFLQTRSLPAGSLRFSSDSQSMFPSTGLEAKITEEEDWSEAPSFASASTMPNRDI